MASSPVQYTTAPVADTGWLTVPGVDTGVPYAVNDAFSDLLTVPCPNEGTITHIKFLDLDDEGIAKLVLLYDTDVSASIAAVNDPISNLTVASNLLAAVQIASFTDLVNHQLGNSQPLETFQLPAGQYEMYAQVITLGTDNITTVPKIRFIFS